MTKREYRLGAYLTLCCVVAVFFASQWPIVGAVIGLVSGLVGGRLYMEGGFDDA